MFRCTVDLMTDFYRDYLPEYITNRDSLSDISNFCKQYYNLSTSNAIFYGLNLQWPTFDFPDNFDCYLISFHTEYIDCDWLQQQTKNVYPNQVFLVSDYNIVDTSIWPDNLHCIQVHTLHWQLETAKLFAGANTKPDMPVHKISSLSMRITQYKKFVTAYILNNFDPQEYVLSWNNWLAKDNDLHGLPPAYSDLESLSVSMPTFVNCNDDKDVVNLSPIFNANWNHPAFTNSLFNCTNETWHYSTTMKNNNPFEYPGPYLTEKTMKPLLAGRPFVPVGQAGTIDHLTSLGFNTDFGIDFSYDRDKGDLTRIRKVFDVLDFICSSDIQDLYQASLPAVVHNATHIQSGSLKSHVDDLNKSSLMELKNCL